MQTAKIKIGDTYAFHRSGTLARFIVQAIVTTRTKAKSVNVIEGYVEEDRQEGKPPQLAAMDPERLIGPYQEQAELAERKAQEDAAREAKKNEEHRLALRDRLALYAFVGVTPPKDAEHYNQPFRITGYYSKDVDVTSGGTKLILARVHALQAQEEDKV